MKFYRVKPEADQHSTLNSRMVLVGNELLTPAIVKKYGVKPEEVEEVDIDVNDTYTFFGARFQNGTGHYTEFLQDPRQSSMPSTYTTKIE